MKKIICNNCPLGYGLLITEEDRLSDTGYCLYCGSPILITDDFNCFDISEEDAQTLIQNDFGIDLEDIDKEVLHENDVI